ncbi:MAG: hypothetical protein B5766_01670 [Candidatus Lumbricidophila eiseniae]|uniref:Uncharacterized protein n=1 Tax=Candidatus Lumbricidiphila eiseniae TaxID=1969409 RepID=A0A2A6FTV1_9MICO|nr:MAG: hypothetical protein B5766_01670 [Candidatus Lumbricidophila eiseniae]
MGRGFLVLSGKVTADFEQTDKPSKNFFSAAIAGKLMHPILNPRVDYQQLQQGANHTIQPRRH